MARAKKKTAKRPPPPAEESSKTLPMVVGFAVALVVAVIWFLQGEANNMERERRLRSIAGGDAWLTENLSWAEQGTKSDERGVWLGLVDEIVRTKPENERPELIALQFKDCERISGASSRRDELYVSARDFSFIQNRLDEPLSGNYWLVAISRNEHGHRLLHDAMPVPGWDPEMFKESK